MPQHCRTKVNREENGARESNVATLASSMTTCMSEFVCPSGKEWRIFIILGEAAKQPNKDKHLFF